MTSIRALKGRHSDGSLVDETTHHQFEGRSEERGARDREDPGPNDVARYAPAHGGTPHGGAGPHNGACDRVGGTQWNAEQGKKYNRHTSACFRAEPPHRKQAREAHPE